MGGLMGRQRGQTLARIATRPFPNDWEGGQRGSDEGKGEGELG